MFVIGFHYIIETFSSVIIMIFHILIQFNHFSFSLALCGAKFLFVPQFNRMECERRFVFTLLTRLLSGMRACICILRMKLERCFVIFNLFDSNVFFPQIIFFHLFDRNQLNIPIFNLCAVH